MGGGDVAHSSSLISPLFYIFIFSNSLLAYNCFPAGIYPSTMRLKGINLF